MSSETASLEESYHVMMTPQEPLSSLKETARGSTSLAAELKPRILNIPRTNNSVVFGLFYSWLVLVFFFFFYIWVSVSSSFTKRRCVILSRLRQDKRYLTTLFNTGTRIHAYWTCQYGLTTDRFDFILSVGSTSWI